MTRRRAVRSRCPECTNGLCDWCDGRLRANERAADLDFAEQMTAIAEDACRVPCWLCRKPTESLSPSIEPPVCDACLLQMAAHL